MKYLYTFLTCVLFSHTAFGQTRVPPQYQNPDAPECLYKTESSMSVIMPDFAVVDATAGDTITVHSPDGDCLGLVVVPDSIGGGYVLTVWGDEGELTDPADNVRGATAGMPLKFLLDSEATMTPQQNDGKEGVSFQSSAFVVLESLTISLGVDLEDDPVPSSPPFSVGKPYPNPVERELSFDFSLDRDAEVTVHDIVGKLVLRDEIPAGSGRYFTDVSQLASGMYAVRVESGIRVSRLTFVKI